MDALKRFFGVSSTQLPETALTSEKTHLNRCEKISGLGTLIKAAFSYLPNRTSKDESFPQFLARSLTSNTLSPPKEKDIRKAYAAVRFLTKSDMEIFKNSISESTPTNTPTDFAEKLLKLIATEKHSSIRSSVASLPRNSTTMTSSKTLESKINNITENYVPPDVQPKNLTPIQNSEKKNLLKKEICSGLGESVAVTNINKVIDTLSESDVNHIEKDYESLNTWLKDLTSTQNNEEFKKKLIETGPANFKVFDHLIPSTSGDPDVNVKSCPFFNFKAAGADENASKNRYRNILPSDHNRVILSGESDYINASKIDLGPNVPYEIDAAQGPLDGEEHSFFQMLREGNIGVVVAFGEPTEGVRSKFSSYYPTVSGEVKKFDGYEYTLLSADTTPLGTLVREIQEKGPNGTTRTFHQIQVTTTDRNAVPQDAMQEAIDLSKKYATPSTVQGEKTRIVAHCSAGCGRTGSFAGCFAISEALKNNPTSFNLAQLITSLRTQRAQMIQTDVQFNMVVKFARDRTLFGQFAEEPSSTGDSNKAEKDLKKHPPGTWLRRTESDGTEVISIKLNTGFKHIKFDSTAANLEKSVHSALTEEGLTFSWEHSLSKRNATLPKEKT